MRTLLKYGFLPGADPNPSVACSFGTSLIVPAAGRLDSRPFSSLSFRWVSYTAIIYCMLFVIGSDGIVDKAVLPRDLIALFFLIERELARADDTPVEPMRWWCPTAGYLFLSTVTPCSSELWLLVWPSFLATVFFAYSFYVFRATPGSPAALVSGSMVEAASDRMTSALCGAIWSPVPPPA